MNNIVNKCDKLSIEKAYLIVLKNNILNLYFYTFFSTKVFNQILETIVYEIKKINIFTLNSD